MAEKIVNLGNLTNPFEVNRLIQYLKDLYRKSHLLSTGTAAPTTVPGNIGDEYIDTNSGKVYKAVGTSSSGDWKILNSIIYFLFFYGILYVQSC